MKTAFSISFLFCCIWLYGQSPTMGLIHYTNETTPGYILFAPYASNDTYLIDECGYVVNQWTCEGFSNNGVYLLEDGSLLRPARNNVSFEMSTETFIELKSWDDELLWRYVTSDEGGLQHHDIELLPNGNVLYFKFQHYEDSVLINLGRQPITLGLTEPEILQIIEVEPTGLNTGNKVWEWHIIDHVVQDFDETKQNYANIAQHPELMDINFTRTSLLGMEDWIHANGLEYMADRDQILFSSRHSSEIYIIDHSTTTEEAASNSGGAAGKGGDFLWRWGNPQVYGIGDNSNRKLWGQHDPKLIETGFPYEGMISVFNNGDQRGEYSSVSIINPIVDNDGNYLKLNDGSFRPESLSFNWEGDVLDTVFYSQYGSGFQLLENGNMMICESRRGRFFELKPDGTAVWAYQNPEGSFIWDQYTPAFWGLGLFRAEKYLPTYAAFENRTLTPLNTVENQNTLSQNCADNVMVDVPDNTFEAISIQYLEGTIKVNNEAIKQLNVFNMSGELIVSSNSNKVKLPNIEKQFVIVNCQLMNHKQINKKLLIGL